MEALLSFYVHTIMNSTVDDSPKYVVRESHSHAYVKRQK